MMAMKQLMIALVACVMALALSGCGGPKYEVYGDVVVHSHWTFSFGTLRDTLEGADPATFKQVKNWLGHDSERVYFKAMLVPGVDVATLKAKRYPLFCDKNDYYYETVPMHVADMASFKIIKWFGDNFWAKDSRCAYYDSLRIDGVDLPTFELVDRWLARDKNHVYMDGLMLADADPATFERIPGSIYYRDKSHVWNFNSLLVGADPATFEVIGHTGFCRDKSHVWYGYENQQLVGADPATFEVIGETNYCRDKSHIWFRAELMQDADYETFVADYDSFAHDKYGTFTAYHRDTDDEPPVEGPEPEPELTE